MGGAWARVDLRPFFTPYWPMNEPSSPNSAASPSPYSANESLSDPPPPPRLDCSDVREPALRGPTLEMNYIYTYIYVHMLFLFNRENDEDTHHLINQFVDWYVDIIWGNDREKRTNCQSNSLFGVLIEASLLGEAVEVSTSSELLLVDGVLPAAISFYKTNNH